ncbi:MAG: hypothetical protein H0T62_01940 [Parachlamydiaceae bacterium]|nr:hypothetical protein [Parachlamydiaceae bacterium]
MNGQSKINSYITENQWDSLAAYLKIQEGYVDYGRYARPKKEGQDTYLPTNYFDIISTCNALVRVTLPEKNTSVNNVLKELVRLYDESIDDSESHRCCGFSSLVTLGRDLYDWVGDFYHSPIDRLWDCCGPNENNQIKWDEKNNIWLKWDETKKEWVVKEHESIRERVKKLQ